MKKSIFAYLLVTSFLCLYSFSIGKWNVFPYWEMKAIYVALQKYKAKPIIAEFESLYVALQKYKAKPSIVKFESLDAKHSSEDKQSFGESVSVFNLQITDSIPLNNFEFSWSRFEVDALGKVGSADFKGSRLWYVNQDDPELISFLKLTNKISQNGGVKAVFSIEDREYVYVAYVDDECASARIVSLSNGEIAYQLPCVPSRYADLNGAGGGVLNLTDKEILLSTGTPTTEHVTNEINQLAQNPSSPWGKILKLRIENDEMVVSIFSKGHRNPQGIAKIDKNIVSVEHGPRGGDEVNFITEGGNYGWPLQSFGSEYDLGLIEKSSKDLEVHELPLVAFNPSIGISYISKCPENYIGYYKPYKCAVVSSMRGNSIFLIVHNGEKVLFTERMEFGSRIRKFFVEGNSLIAVTDFEGLIVGKFEVLTK